MTIYHGSALIYFLHEDMMWKIAFVDLVVNNNK